ncbi:MAG: RNA polymerase sigma factor, partial [Actinomycetota bacterium]|nr:RNA polymerase sigma factor [Actinomycetota bacterium]
ARSALTLRLVCGLSTAEIARAYLVPEATLAARITRAKKKIAATAIPYRVPEGPELAERTDDVLTVVHLVFTAGHTATGGDELVRADLVARSLDLARVLATLLPEDPEVVGLLALLELTDARREARVGADGELVLLEDQDRSRWDRTSIEHGLAMLDRGLRLTGPQRPPGRFLLQAALAAVHAEAATWDDTDWAAAVLLYDQLLVVWPSPVVALNRAVAVGFADGPAAGLAALDGLADEPMLARYHYLPTARAELLRRLGRGAEAAAAYRDALTLVTAEPERRHLERRLATLAE